MILFTFTESSLLLNVLDLDPDRRSASLLCVDSAVGGLRELTPESGEDL